MTAVKHASAWLWRDPVSIQDPRPTINCNRQCRRTDGKVENLPQRTHPVEAGLSITEVGIVLEVGTMVSERSYHWREINKAWIPDIRSGCTAPNVFPELYVSCFISSQQLIIVNICLGPPKFQADIILFSSHPRGMGQVLPFCLTDVRVPEGSKEFANDQVSMYLGVLRDTNLLL